MLIVDDILNQILAKKQTSTFSKKEDPLVRKISEDDDDDYLNSNYMKSKKVTFEPPPNRKRIYEPDPFFDDNLLKTVEISSSNKYLDGINLDNKPKPFSNSEKRSDFNKS
jgi:hypothetical protein